MRRNLALGTVLVSLTPLVVACNALFGVDDYTVEAGNGGAQQQGGAGGVGGGGECVPNEVMSCYDGPDGTLDVGACHAGTQTCAEDGSGLSACEGQVQPALDDCSTAEDEDCDGLACGQPVWARTISDDATNMANQLVESVATSDETIVVVGTYREAMRIGASLLAGDNSTDGFVAAFDVLGNLSWSQRLGGTSTQRPRAVALDPMGNVYVVGEFQAELEAGGESTTNVQGWDAFVIKLDPDGNHLWTRTYGGDGSVRALAVAASGNGRLIVTGEFSDTVGFGMSNLDAGASMDGFTLMLDDGGAEGWVSHEDSSGAGASRAVAISGNSVYVGATFAGNVTVNSADLDAGGDTDVLLLALNLANGALTGHLQLTGDADTEPTGIHADETGVIVGGQFVGGTLNLGGAPVNAMTTQLFVAHYAPSLDVPTWTQIAGGAGDVELQDLAVDSTGEIALVGRFSQDMSLATLTATSAGGSDIFVAKLDDTGAPRFLSSFGDSGQDGGTAVGILPTPRHVVFGGSFADTIDFDVAAYSAQAIDGVVARLGP